MNKQEFLSALRTRLSSLPPQEAEKSVEYYSELIDDMTDDGKSEQEAIDSLGSLDDIVKNIMLDAPFHTILKSKAAQRRGMKPFEIVLLVLGFPLWFSLLSASVVVFLAIYISIWALIVSVWAAIAAIGISGLAGIILSVSLLVASGAPGVFVLGLALALLGLSVPMFFAARLLSVALVRATGAFVRLTKNLIIGKTKKA